MNIHQYFKIGMSTALTALLASLSAAHAETCKYVDKEQRVVYSNVPVEGARKVLCFDPTPPAPKVAPPATAKSEAASEDSARVEPQTQRKRDQERRRILEKELADEQQHLVDAKKSLAEGESTRLSDEHNNFQKYLDRVQQLRDKVSTHERNIQAITSELANLR
jgi:Domain of unknown function (DUF4124)